MKSKIIAISSIALLSSCTWAGKQSDDFMNWANHAMPTFDGSRPGVKQNNAIIPDHYNGYPYDPNAPRTPMTAPGVSGANTPPLPGQNVMSSPGLTPAQAASAAEGGNSRPLPRSAYAAPTNYQGTMTPPSNGMVPPPPPLGSYSTQSMSSSSDAGRRQPASQLPPSAIKPVPYGIHQPVAANGKPDDFPSEYKSPPSPAMDQNYDSRTPPPPI